MSTIFPHWIEKAKHEIKHVFSLTEDKAEDAEIDQFVRAGIKMQGTNLWVLIFAIFIASIGLNVNSTAVIIGAMLISPLMGPIIGVGYGAGIYDFSLIRNSLKNLAIAVVISLLASTLYFWISPLTHAQSELLARTTPNLWDVLIALFGGLAGIVGITRREKSNVIPGVAIATALMPPLCTAGYEIANGSWIYAAGALYLFTINSVFIALSSMFVIRYLHVQPKSFVDTQTTRRVKRYTFMIALLTALPSAYLAYILVQNEVFKAKATQFISDNISSKSVYVAQAQINPKSHLIDVTLMGDFLPSDELDKIKQSLKANGLADTELRVHQAANHSVDVNALRSGLLNDLNTHSIKSESQKDQQIQILENLLNKQQPQPKEPDIAQNIQQISQEMMILFPQVEKVWLSLGTSWSKDSDRASEQTYILNVLSKRPLKVIDQTKISEWFTERMQGKVVKVIFAVHAK